MSNSITEPLRLAVGSHEAGSGKGCAMNVISWENGDTEITDLPSCADIGLAEMVQGFNDHYCGHQPQMWPTRGALLCPDCSRDVLALAHRLVGTRIPGSRNPIWTADPYSLGMVLATRLADGLGVAHALIDEFERLNGVTAPEPDPVVVSAAVAAMTA